MTVASSGDLGGAGLGAPAGGRSRPWAARVRRFAAAAGPGCLIAVGYTDPGNWATSIAGGSRFGYLLLSVVLISNLMAIALQSLSVRLAIATGRDLAEASRDALPPVARVPMWLFAEAAIVATDVAEVVGTAIGLQLLFGLPLLAGCLVTVFDTVLVLCLHRSGGRRLEGIVLGLMLVVAASVAVQLAGLGPDWASVMAGFVPGPSLFADPHAVWLAVGILGATEITAPSICRLVASCDDDGKPKECSKDTRLIVSAKNRSVTAVRRRAGIAGRSLPRRRHARPRPADDGLSPEGFSSVRRRGRERSGGARAASRDASLVRLVGVRRQCRADRAEGRRDRQRTPPDPGGPVRILSGELRRRFREFPTCRDFARARPAARCSHGLRDTEVHAFGIR